MKKLTALFAFFLIIYLTVNAQPEKKLKKVMELKIAAEGGANGAAVVWHPVLKKYYCPIAGNVAYPLTIFDAAGKIVSKPGQETLFDIRGFWYNPKTKKMYANGYNEFGWAEYKMDPKGNPTGVKVLFTGLNQPNEQSVGTYDAVKNAVYFLDNSLIYTYSTATGQVIGDPVILNTTVAKTGEQGAEEDSLDLFERMDDGSIPSDYNTTTAIYTGVKGREFGLLNIMEKRIDLFDRSSGNITMKLVLPDNAPIYNMFNFSFTNGMYWLFNKETRVWTAYK
jgi:hypothetical protein